ncbi:hypothetical protein LCGC14_2557400, partial [marine sediment metagenome]
NVPEISQGAITPDNLIPINFTINIDGNWSEYVNTYSWVTGHGTEKDPYIIEGIHVTNKDQTAHISIKTTEHFIIRNVTVSNYAKPYGHYTFAGIYIEKGEFGLIDNVTIINSSIGISLYEAKDSLKITNSKFIGSHNDSKTGMGSAILIHEAKGVNISYNDIYNFYNGIVVYDAEEVYIENNRIETNFGYISDTGIYFYGVNDSAIISNEFYGCDFTGHNYAEPVISSKVDGLSTSLLENSINITVFGNNFYDLNGNLIKESDVPEPEPEPDDIPESIPINKPNMIFDWFWIGVILVVDCVIISLYLFWKLKIKRRDIN